MAWHTVDEERQAAVRLRIFPAYEVAEETPDRSNPDRSPEDDHPDIFNIEDYWAGRKPAMRRSARLAA